MNHTDVHTMFSLSYSNYLVLHRTLLQSMPIEWQHRFVAMIDELDAAFAHIEKAECYEVTPAVEREVWDLTDAQRRQLGISCNEHEGRNYYRDKYGNEIDAENRVLVPVGDDPVPHYNRGRTRIEPAALAPAAEVPVLRRFKAVNSGVIWIEAAPGVGYYCPESWGPGVRALCVDMGDGKRREDFSSVVDLEAAPAAADAGQA